MGKGYVPPSNALEMGMSGGNMAWNNPQDPNSGYNPEAVQRRLSMGLSAQEQPRQPYGMGQQGMGNAYGYGGGMGNPWGAMSGAMPAGWEEAARQTRLAQQQNPLIAPYLGNGGTGGPVDASFGVPMSQAQAPQVAPPPPQAQLQQAPNSYQIPGWNTVGGRPQSYQIPGYNRWP
jgi:hypothetical protein